MLAYVKTTAIAGFGLAMFAAAAVTPAAADRGGDIAAGIIGGAVVGTILGQSTQPARPVYVAPAREYRRSCSELRDRAEYAEDRGQYERARYLRREYRECRGE